MGETGPPKKRTYAQNSLMDVADHAFNKLESRFRSCWRRGCYALLLLWCTVLPAMAEPWAAPGDLLLVHDLQLLNDSSSMDIPLSIWPLSWGDIGRGLATIERRDLDPSVHAAYARVAQQLDQQTKAGGRLTLGASVAEHPRLVRGFEATPRDEAQALAAVSWLGNWLAVKLQATVVANPLDDDSIRLDGSYLGIALSNWMLSAGWQERWWGPGRDGSLILSTNAHPTPGLSLQRNASMPFRSKWLSWIGPWSFTAFVSELDDEREINDVRLLGMRFTFKPIESLEIGLSRTAQWCGDERPCDFQALTDLLLGNDNRGVSVDPATEPGNQLAGIDVRWRLPQPIPAAFYMQWIGEDTRQGGPAIGNWLRQVGVEYWGSVAGLQYRTHFEVSDTACHQGGFGFSETRTNCAYRHSIYQTGYRYQGRSLGHGVDGDSLVYSIGSTWVQPDGNRWTILMRYMEINRAGPVDVRHSLSATPQDTVDVMLTHERLTGMGRFLFGLGYSRLDRGAGGTSPDGIEAFIGWSTD